jgi:hypothetical protein
MNETYSGTWHYGKRIQNTEGLRHKNDQANLIPVSVPAIITPEVRQEAQAGSLILQSGKRFAESKI